VDTKVRKYLLSYGGKAFNTDGWFRMPVGIWIYPKPFISNALVLQPLGNTTFKSKSIVFKKGNLCSLTSPTGMKLLAFWLIDVHIRVGVPRNQRLLGLKISGMILNRLHERIREFEEDELIETLGRQCSKAGRRFEL
jgi:hypothetical protein